MVGAEAHGKGMGDGALQRLSDLCCLGWQPSRRPRTRCPQPAPRSSCRVCLHDPSLPSRCGTKGSKLTALLIIYKLDFLKSVRLLFTFFVPGVVVERAKRARVLCVCMSITAGYTGNGRACVCVWPTCTTFVDRTSQGYRADAARARRCRDSSSSSPLISNSTCTTPRLQTHTHNCITGAPTHTRSSPPTHPPLPRCPASRQTSSLTSRTCSSVPSGAP